MSSYEELIEEVDRKATIVAGLMRGPAGEEVLAILRDMFDHDDCRGETTEDTYYKLGQRDVIKYLEALLRRVRH